MSKSFTITEFMRRFPGDVITRVIPDVKWKTLLPVITDKVKQGSIISTDEMMSYRILPKLGYNHGRVEHGSKQWKNGIHHTNSIEGFWSLLKRSILGTHIHVSRKHLPKYLGEFEYRYNMRSNPSLMFDRLLVSF